MPETQEESATNLGLADVPSGHEEATPTPDEAYHAAAAETDDEMTSSLGLDDVPEEVQEAKPDPQLYLVVAPSGGIARVEQMATLEELRARLIALEGDDVQVFVFSGVRFQLTRAPYRHLIPASGEPIELFAVPEPEALEIDDEGYLGPPSSALEIPQPLPEELDEEGAGGDLDGWDDEPNDRDEEPPP